MDDSSLERLRGWIERDRERALDAVRLDALAAALDDGEDCATAGRWGALVGYDPRSGRRRLVQFDRRGHLTAAVHWRSDGSLLRAKCLTTHGHWVGIEPASAEHPAWGSSDRVWLLDASSPWAPREALTVFQSLDYAHLTFIPPLAEPRLLPPGAGTALLNLLAGLMKDQGVPRVRYRGPYPTEQLFTALLECFRYEPSDIDPLARFMDGARLDWMPAPHETHHVDTSVCVQLRHELEKVTFNGVTFYRPDWQTVTRREPRVVRRDGNRYVCSLWALGRSLEDRLILDDAGEVLESPEAARDGRPPAPLSPVWRAALVDLISHESAAALSDSIRETIGALTLVWAPVPGDVLDIDSDTMRISTSLRDAALATLAEVPRGAPRAERAIQVALEVARLLGPSVRLRAQMLLETKSEDEQRRALDRTETPSALSESVGRLLALLVSGSA